MVLVDPLGRVTVVEVRLSPIAEKPDVVGIIEVLTAVVGQRRASCKV